MGSFKDFLTNLGKGARAKSPELLAGGAVVGVFVTAYLALKAGPDIEWILDEHKRLKNQIDPEEVPRLKKDTAVELVKTIAPTAIAAAATSAMIIAGNRISAKRLAVATTAYTISQVSLRELRAKTREILGEKKANEIETEVAKDRLKRSESERTPEQLANPDFIQQTGTGNVLCWDPILNHYWYSNAEFIGQQINALTAQVMGEMYASLNDFYELLHLAPTGIGDEFGWNADDIVNGQLPIHKRAILSDIHGGVPCIVIEYDIRPRFDYRNLH